MKMRMLDRILLTIYTFIIFILSLVLMGISIHIIPIRGALKSEVFFRYNWPLTLIISLIFLFVSLRLLVSGFSTKKPSSSLLTTTELGIIRVSVNTLDNLAQKAVRSFEQIKEAKSIIIPDTDGVKIQLKITILPEVKMPELTQNIQARVKEYVEQLSGISVKEVQVYIDSLAVISKNRVE